MTDQPQEATGHKTLRNVSCEHDSTRVDGWLDDHCLRCGMAGYFKDGHYIDPTGKPTKGHPGGATLIWPAPTEPRPVAAEERTDPREPCECLGGVCSNRWDQEHYCRQLPKPSRARPVAASPGEGEEWWIQRYVRQDEPDGLHGFVGIRPAEPDKWYRVVRADVAASELAALRQELCECEKCGHRQAEPNWCHKCGHRTSMPEWAKKLVGELQEHRDRADELEAQLATERQRAEEAERALDRYRFRTPKDNPAPDDCPTCGLSPSNYTAGEYDDLIDRAEARLSALLETVERIANGDFAAETGLDKPTAVEIARTASEQAHSTGEGGRV